MREVGLVENMVDSSWVSMVRVELLSSRSSSYDVWNNKPWAHPVQLYARPWQVLHTDEHFWHVDDTLPLPTSTPLLFTPTVI